MCALRSGVVEHWNIKTATPITAYLCRDKDKDLVRGLGVLGRSTANRTVLSCTDSGHVRFTPLEAALRSEASNTRKLEVGANVQCMRLDVFAQRQFATGGKEHFLKLWDVETGKLLFKQNKAQQRTENRTERDRPVPPATSNNFIPGCGLRVATNCSFHTRCMPSDMASFIKSYLPATR